MLKVNDTILVPINTKLINADTNNSETYLFHEKLYKDAVHWPIGEDIPKGSFVTVLEIEDYDNSIDAVPTPTWIKLSFEDQEGWVLWSWFFDIGDLCHYPEGYICSTSLETYVDDKGILQRVKDGPTIPPGSTGKIISVEPIENHVEAWIHMDFGDGVQGSVLGFHRVKGYTPSTQEFLYF